MKREPKREILLKTIKILKTKISIEDKPLSRKDLKKLEKTQKQVEEIYTGQEEKDRKFCYSHIF
jgi:hypothetical protein